VGQQTKPVSGLERGCASLIEKGRVIIHLFNPEMIIIWKPWNPLTQQLFWQAPLCSNKY